MEVGPCLLDLCPIDRVRFRFDRHHDGSITKLVNQPGNAIGCLEDGRCCIDSKQDVWIGAHRRDVASQILGQFDVSHRRQVTTGGDSLIERF